MTAQLASPPSSARRASSPDAARPLQSTAPIDVGRSVEAPGPVERVVRTRLRLTRRGRAVLASLGALPIVAGAFVLGLNGGGAVASGEPVAVEFQYVTVHAGESLWTLAEELAPEADPRDVVDDILALNQLASAGLEPGQRLAVPAQYEAAR